MGLGIIEPKQLVVPGTIQLFDSAAHVHSTEHLKHTPDGKIILAPQPSDSVNDPLNWSVWKKDFVFFVLLVGTICSTIHGPLLSPVTVELSVEFNRSINDIAQLSSYMSLIIAVAAYFFAAFAHVWGKRPVFVFSMATLVAADAWAATASGYQSLFGARMFSGIGQGAFECFALAVVPDLYFVHQRSLRIALFWIFLQTGVYIGVPIATAIIDEADWHMAFTALAITEGITLVLLFLFFEEPAYRREHIDPLANMSEDAVLEKVHHSDVHQVEVEGEQEAPPTERRKSFIQQLYLYNGRFSQNNIFALLYRSFILTFHPTIFWAATAGLLTAWPVGCSFTIAAFMTLPPYNMGPQAIANMYIAPWLGGLIALIVADPFFQWLSQWLTKKNNNVYEPEFRLYATIPGILLFILGAVGWGWGSQVGVGWGGIAVFFGFMLAGALIYNAGIIGYLIDAHREWANESQVILFVAKVHSPITIWLTAEHLPLWYGLLFRALVVIGWCEDCVGCCWSCFWRSCVDWYSCVYLGETDACLLESPSFPLDSRYQARESIEGVYSIVFQIMSKSCL